MRSNGRTYALHRWLYRLFFCLLIVLLAASVLSVLCSLVAAPPFISDVTRRLSAVFPPKALSSAISAVGVTGIVFGWLITRAEDRVCGVRYVELVEWAYPHFFLCYFLAFIPTSLVGIFAGQAGLFWPTFYASLGVLGHICLLIRVCLVFVIQPGIREQKAFAYYTETLNSKENGPKAAHSILLKAADYTHMLIRKERQNERCAELIRLWRSGLELLTEESLHTDGAYLSWDRVTDRYWKNEPDSILSCIQLSRDLWNALLEGENSPRARAEIIDPLLSVLTEEEPAHIQMSIHLGLAQVLLDLHASPENAVEETAKLIQFRQHTEAAKALTGGLAAALMVRFMDDREAASEGLSRMHDLLWPQLDRLLEGLEQIRVSPNDGRVLPAPDRRPWTALLFLYGEWTERNLLHISLDRYLLWVDRRFVDRSSRQNILFDLRREGWHIEMLACCLDCLEKEDQLLRLG